MGVSSGGQPGAAPGDKGEDGVAMITPVIKAIVAHTGTVPLSSYQGSALFGGAVGGDGGSSGGHGGEGGGGIILVCGSLDFSGTVDVSGQPGTISPGNAQGAGGGGGGFAIIRSPQWGVDTGKVDVKGGTGGTCGGHSKCGLGGNGGSGWSVKFQD